MIGFVLDGQPITTNRCLGSMPKTLRLTGQCIKPVSYTHLWPPERPQVDVGTLTIDQVQSEDASPVRDINFDPLVLPNGIAGSDDPLSLIHIF